MNDGGLRAKGKVPWRTRPAPAHAGIQIMLAEKRLPFPAGELRALIKVQHDLARWLLTPDSHRQRPHGEVSGQAGSGGPASDAT